jgi:hypothetical protein
MLSKLLELLGAYPNQLTQEQICAQLGVNPQSLKNMLDILVRKGRLTTIPPQKDGGCSGSCRDCPIAQDCSLDEEHPETFYRIETISLF